MKRILMGLSCALCLITLPGCITMLDSGDAARQQEDRLLLQEELNRTKGKLETFTMEYQRMLRELEALKGTAASSKGETSATQERLNEIERRVNMLEGARISDRQAIVDQLSGKLADIMGSGSAGGPTRKIKSVSTVLITNPAQRGASAAGAKGYEHIVQEGETLSAIAAAYKVKPGAIMEANQLSDPDTLLKGQKLFIPQP